jgi:hypothetical protein
MENEQASLVLENIYESIHVTAWDDDKVWMNLMVERASVRVMLTKPEAARLIEMLQTAMAEKETTNA